MTTAYQNRWYAVHTHPNAEGRAASHIRRQGFGTYLPRYRKKRRHARRVEIVHAALFPRYLFVTIDMASQRWRAINSTFGVTGLVGNGEDPAPVPCSVIDALRDREDEHGLIRLPKRPQFSPGEKVRLVAGAFAECLGLFEDMRDHERVSVLLDLLGRRVRVFLNLDSVEAA